MATTSAKTRIQRRKTAKREPRATAIHRAKGDTHIVGIGNLRVIICEEDGIWFAQGLEIDYAANGTSLDEVKSNFEHGLASTIGLHIQTFDGIENLLVPAPAKVWRELSGEKRRFRYSQVSAHELERTPAFKKLPYSGISYIEPQAVAA